MDSQKDEEGDPDTHKSSSPDGGTPGHRTLRTWRAGKLGRRSEISDQWRRGEILLWAAEVEVNELI